MNEKTKSKSLEATLIAKSSQPASEHAAPREFKEKTALVIGEE